MTCPHCGARNTADAPWCTQCLQPLGREEPPTPTPPSPDASGGGPPPARTSTPVAPGAAMPGGTDRDRAFRSVAGDVEWRCPACDTWNRLEASTCPVCGHRLATSVTGGTGTAVAGRVQRARGLLWIAAGVGGVLVVVSVVLLVLALRTGAGA